MKKQFITLAPIKYGVRNLVRTAIGVIIFLITVISPALRAQNIAINESGNPANSKAILDIQPDVGLNKGLLIPRLTTAQRGNIASPPQGLLIYNTDTKCIEFYDGVWQSANCACSVAPAVPGAISGPAAVCASTSGVLYSISSVPTATSYTWTVPAGLGTIASGQGSTSITVNFSAGASTGNITVTATNSCGTSAASSLFVTKTSGAPAAPGAITGPATYQCPNQTGQVYSISAVANATSYNWTVPPDATITAGQGTISIIVTWGSTSGNVCVSASNGCGTSAVTCKAVTLQVAQTYSVAGSYTFTVPPCITSITVEVWGAGASGGGGTNSGGAGGGGGGGGYGSKTFTVVGGTSYAVTVGAGGVQVSGCCCGSCTATNGFDGTSSVFGALISATGGAKGTAGSVAIQGTGGSGGTCVTGTINITGGTGGNGINGFPSDGGNGGNGGNGGGGGLGGNSGICNVGNSNGCSGSAPGGGGGGGGETNNSAEGKGAAGAAGQVRITW